MYMCEYVLKSAVLVVCVCDNVMDIISTVGCLT